MRQSAKLKDDLGDSVSGGVDTREAGASGRGGEGCARSSLCVNPEIFATFPPDLTNPVLQTESFEVQMPPTGDSVTSSKSHLNAIHELIRAPTAVTHIRVALLLK